MNKDMGREPGTEPAQEDGDPFAGLSPENRAILERQARGLQQEGRAQAEANSEPLPGPLLEAFAGLPEQVEGFRVRKLVQWDFVILRRLGSPLLEQLRRAGSGKSGKAGKKAQEQTPFGDDQASDMVYQFTRPCEEVEALMQRSGVAGFRAAARTEVGMKLGPVEVAILVKMVERSVVLGFATAIKYGRKNDSGGQDTVFTGPAIPPAAKTGSGGGSTTNAGC